MASESKTRRAYDPTPFLPALAGIIVESAEVSDRFQWDFRLTFAELLVDNHYAAINKFRPQRRYSNLRGSSWHFNANHSRCPSDQKRGRYSNG
jgi:hypothetical protein